MNYEIFIPPPCKEDLLPSQRQSSRKVMNHKSFLISAIKKCIFFIFKFGLLCWKPVHRLGFIIFNREMIMVAQLYTPQYLLEEHRENIPGICFRCCNPPVWRERAGRWASRQVGSRRWLHSPSWSSLSNPQPLEAAPSCPPPPGWQGRGIQPPSQLAWCPPPPPSVRWSCTPHRNRAKKKMPGLIDLKVL